MKTKLIWAALCIAFALPACQQQKSNTRSVEEDMHAAKVREVEEWLGVKLREVDSIPANSNGGISYDSLKVIMEKHPEGFRKMLQNAFDTATIKVEVVPIEHD